MVELTSIDEIVEKSQARSESQITRPEAKQHDEQTFNETIGKPDIVEPDAIEPDAIDPDAIDPDAIDPDAIDPDLIDPKPMEESVDTNHLVRDSDDPALAQAAATDENETNDQANSIFHLPTREIPAATEPSEVVDPSLAIDAQSEQIPNRLSRVQADALVMQADQGHVYAKEAVKTQLLFGDESVIAAINARDDQLGEPMLDLLNGLADLGDPGIDALSKLDQSGFDFTMDGVGRAAGAIASIGNWQ